MECFDPHTNKWSNCAAMLKRRGGVGVGVCAGCIYAIGGHDAPASSQMSRLQETVDRLLFFLCLLCVFAVQCWSSVSAFMVLEVKMSFDRI